MRPNFVIASLDPCFCEAQSNWSRFLANSDRGKFVCYDKDLANLLSRFSIKLIDKEVSSGYMRKRMFVLITEWGKFE